MVRLIEHGGGGRWSSQSCLAVRIWGIVRTGGGEISGAGLALSCLENRGLGNQPKGRS